MRRIVSCLVVALLIGLVASVCIGSSPWGHTFLAKGLLDQAVPIGPVSGTAWVKPWSAAVTVSAWTSAGVRIAPAASWSDTVATIAPGDWYPLKFYGVSVARLYVRTLNSYSTYDSNATAVSIDVE
jgi:hypothetical protein